MPRKTKVPKELSKAVIKKTKAVPKEKVEKKAVPKAKVEKKTVPKEKVEKKAVPKAKVEKKAVPKEKVEKKKADPKAKVEKKKADPKAKVEKKKEVPKDKVEKKRAVPKEKVEKKKAAPKAKVEKKKAVPKTKVEKKKAVPKDKVEKTKAVPKEKVEKKKAVPKAKVEKKKADPKTKVEKKKAVPKDKVEKTKAVPKAKVEKNKAAPKEKVEKKKVVSKVARGGVVVDTHHPIKNVSLYDLQNVRFTPFSDPFSAKASPAPAPAEAKPAKTYAEETDEAIKKAIEKAKEKATATTKTDEEVQAEMVLIQSELIDILNKEVIQKSKAIAKTAKEAKEIATTKTAEEAQAEKAQAEMVLIQSELIDILNKEDIQELKGHTYNELITRLNELKKQSKDHIYNGLIIRLEELKTAEEQSEKELKIYDMLITELRKKKSSLILIEDKGINDRLNEFIIPAEEIINLTTPINLNIKLEKISEEERIDTTTPKVSEILEFDDIKNENRGIKEGEEKYYYSEKKIHQNDEALQANIDNLFKTKEEQKGGKKNIKHVRKAKYGKKYKGGMLKLDKIAIMIKQKLKESVFGITLDLDGQIIEKIEKECEEYREKLKTESENIIQKLTDPNQKEIVQNFFTYVLADKNDSGKDSVVKAFHAKRKLYYATGDQIKTYKQKLDAISNTLNSIQYVDSYIFNKLYRPNEKFYVYGMQLPHQFDRVKLLGTMYKLHKSGIYSIVDLQDCNSGINGGHPMITRGVGCNLFDRNCEIDMWALAIATADKSQSPPDNAKYYGIEYSDMSAGTLRTWNAISTIKNIKGENNKLVVHCLAGAGRTGSVILYLLMRDSYLPGSNDKVNNPYIKNLKELMAQLYFGFDNIPKFIENFLLPYFTIVDDEDLSDNRYYIKYMIAELFELGENKDDIDRIILFRKRLNFIIVFLARHFDITEFVTYHHTDFGKKSQDFNQSITKGSKKTADPDTYDKQNILLTVQFCQAYTVKITKWEDYNIDNILSDSSDIRYDEVMNWIE